MFQECIQQGQTKTRIYIYKWHMCPGSYNKNPEEEEEEEEEESKKQEGAKKEVRGML